jgi:iron-sulfur cluster assembly accessory protein
MDTVTENNAVVVLTDSAVNQIRSLLANEKSGAGKTLRIYVEGGGCSGMQYGMVFDEKRDDDFSSEFKGVSVLVDPFSANYLRGAVIDFKDELTGGGFKISNPNARHSCGCGKSFEA